MGWEGSRSRNTDRMNKNRIKGQSTRGEEATDAYVRYSVKSVHGRFSLLCVKATSLILRSIDKESAAEQSVCRESAVAIVPPSKQHQREGPNPAWATTCISEHIATEQKNTEMYEGATERRNAEQHSRKNTLYYIVICYGLTMY